MTNSNSPLVSIITPSYNSEKFIASTINSVIDQTFQDWELIIIDDASKDNTVSIIKQFSDKDSRIIFIRNKENSGAAITRNKGLINARGRFIAFLDSDDLWNNTKLERQLEFMRTNKSPISFTSYNLIDQNGEKLNKTIKVVPSIGYKGYLKNTIIGMSTSIIDTDIVNNDFHFANIRTRQDTYLWITLLKMGYIANGLPEVLGSYRVRKDSISSDKIKAAKKVWYLYYKMEKLGILTSIYYFSFYLFNALKKRIIN